MIFNSVNGSVANHERCECHNCTQARWKMSAERIRELNQASALSGSNDLSNYAGIKQQGFAQAVNGGPQTGFMGEVS